MLFSTRPIALAGLLAVLATPACETTDPLPPPPPPEPTRPAVIEGKANVDSVRVLKLESFPVQAFAYVTGYLPDRATELGRVEQTFTGSEFVIALFTTRSAESIATTELDPYEKRIPLEITGLPAGTYRVTVNGTSTTFSLSAQNGDPNPPADNGPIAPGFPPVPGF